jgi:hypothetical protein
VTGGQFQQIFAQRAGECAEPEPTWIPPEWIGPTSGELGESVSLAVVVARSDRRGDLSLDESFFPVVWTESGYRTPWLSELPDLE